MALSALFSGRLEPRSALSPLPDRRSDAPRARDSALDLLRAVALARVVLWHAFAATWMTYFAAMPVMFFVAGTLLAPSGRRGSHVALVIRRARRLLIPLWVYGAVVAAAGTLRHGMDAGAPGLSPGALAHAATWILPVVDPVGADWHGGWLSTHLWYLRAYLWMLLLAPVLLLLARRLAVSVPVFAFGVIAVELAGRHPALAAEPLRVLVGDTITYGFFVVLGIAYSRRGEPMDRRLLAAVAAGSGVATVVYVRLVGLPAGGVNESFAAVALTGLGWLFAVGAAEHPVRRLAELPRLRRLTSALTRRALTIYLWHPAAIVAAYAFLEGWDRTPRLTMVKQWPVPAAVVVAVTVVVTALTVGAVGWVEDVAARRTAASRPARPARRAFRPTTRLAALVPFAAAALALGVPLLAVPVAEEEAGAAEITRRAVPRPPSYRAAPGNAAFVRGPRAEAQTTSTTLAPITVSGPALQAALDQWLAGQPGVGSVAVAVAAAGQAWTGEAHRPGAVNRLSAGDEFRTASLTKTITGALVLEQVAAGGLDLDAPVPAVRGVRVPPEIAALTPRELLQHTSALIEYAAAPGYDPDRELAPRQAVSLAARAGLQGPAGVGVAYSNTNYLYLGLILEEITGRPYADLVADLARAHGLRRTRLDPSDRGRVGHASGGVTSTLDDLARWGDALFTPGRVLPAPMVSRLTTVDEYNVGLGTWPLCPCSADAHGVKGYSAIGHHVGFGGLFHFPGGMTIAVRFEPTPEPYDAAIVGLGQTLHSALAAKPALR